MNKHNAKTIALTITNQQLLDMLNNAKHSIKNWNIVSIVNKSLSKGTAWNILGRDFDVNHEYHILAKINMVREFGEYLPQELKPTMKRKIKNINYHHEEPIF